MNILKQMFVMLLVGGFAIAPLSYLDATYSKTAPKPTYEQGTGVSTSDSGGTTEEKPADEKDTKSGGEPTSGDATMPSGGK